jgi:hypothetical protein
MVSFFLVEEMIVDNLVFLHQINSPNLILLSIPQGKFKALKALRSLVDIIIPWLSSKVLGIFTAGAKMIRVSSGLEPSAKESSRHNR